MNASNETDSRESTGSRRASRWVVGIAALIAAGLYVWASMLQTVRYEIEIEPPQLFTGAADSARITARAMNRWDGRIPFAHPSISVELLEGEDLGSVAMRDEEHAVVFLSNGLGEGQAVLRVFVEDWPFPMLAVIHITAPVAAASFLNSRSDV